jgi:hypothetical protein
MHQIDVQLIDLHSDCAMILYSAILLLGKHALEIGDFVETIGAHSR